MDATQELDKQARTKKKVKPPDPILALIILLWKPWFPSLVNEHAKQPSEAFPLLKPWWAHWWL